MEEGPLYGCIEAGGTKFVLGIVGGPDTIHSRHRIDTTTPAETLGAAIDWMRAERDKHGPLAAIGIASFGPVELNPVSPDWGSITETTKPGWSGARFATLFGEAFRVPVGFDTDVNGAALSEHIWGASRGTGSSVYLTIGTGVGGGAILGGGIHRGLTHPEMGHVRIPRHPLDIDFEGICPFHGDCLEGLASGPAIKARWGCSLSELPADHQAHHIVAWYLAQMVTTLQSILEPERVILGGGVMQTQGLIERVRLEAEMLGSGYFRGKAQEIVVSPALGDNAGLLGALALAQRALS